MPALLLLRCNCTVSFLMEGKPEFWVEPWKRWSILSSFQHILEAEELLNTKKEADNNGYDADEARTDRGTRLRR